MFKRNPILNITLLIAASALACGCAGLVEGKKSRQTSSVVDFLYPDKSDVVEKPAIPELTLPMDVGIAFVPATGGHYSDSRLDSTEQHKLMERIAADFRKYDFIRNIELIPTAYLRTGGSFDNLDQIRTMYGVDVITLLSFDQVQYTDEGLLSLTYWTIAGAYIFKGEKNDTSTMIDATVYDIASRKMLFRAPGVSQVKGRATFVNQSEELRKDSREGFAEAADDLAVNLKAELERFKEKIKERPEEVKVVQSGGYRGGGYLGAGFTLLFLVLAGAAVWHDHRKRIR
jgi:rhombotail lipoprotein